MTSSFRLSVSLLTLIAGLSMGAPAMARTDCSSNANLAHVHRRLDGAIDQLSHDQRDYGNFLRIQGDFRDGERVRRTGGQREAA